MSLSSYKVGSAVPVSDMNRAREFYESKLGLAAQNGDRDGGCTYSCGENTSLHVFPSPQNAGKSSTTIVGWTVDDIDRVVGELTANGVLFERYEEGPYATDERGIATIGSTKGAWFKDPDGNILGLRQA